MKISYLNSSSSYKQVCLFDKCHPSYSFTWIKVVCLIFYKTSTKTHQGCLFKNVKIPEQNATHTGHL